MKKIQKSIMMLAALLTAGAAMTSCSNEDSIAKEQNANGKYIMAVDATKGALTRALAIDDEGALKATWTAIDDKVEVYPENLTKKITTLTAQSSGASTKLLGDFPEEDLPSKDDKLILFYPSFAKDYTEQDGTFDNIDKVDYAWCEVTVSDVNDVNKTINTEPVRFWNFQSFVKFTLSHGEDNINATSLTVNFKNTTTWGTQDALVQKYNTDNTFTQGDITINPTTPTNVIWAALSKGGESPFTMSLIATTNSNVYFYTKSDVAFDHGNYYTASVNMKGLNQVHAANITDIFGVYTHLTKEQAWKLAKAQKAINGGEKPVLVVYNTEGSNIFSATCYYASSADEAATENSGTAATLAGLAGSADAYYVEP